jgi:PEP-CTERM motif
MPSLEKKTNPLFYRKELGMAKKMSVFLFVLFLVVGMSNGSSAYTVNVGQNTGTTQVTTALTGFATSGNQMDGMAVTAFFSGGGSQTVSWVDSGGLSGGVTGTGWSLAQSGDTFGGPWTLSAAGASLTGFKIDAGVGDTVFDRTFSGLEGTDGSARGLDFALSPNPSTTGIITATYIDSVALTGFPPVGDLFRYLDVQFNFSFTNGSLKFIADTDNLQLSGDIKPIPEPATMLLLGIGLIGIAGLGRRKF